MYPDVTLNVGCATLPFNSQPPVSMPNDDSFANSRTAPTSYLLEHMRGKVRQLCACLNKLPEFSCERCKKNAVAKQEGSYPFLGDKDPREECGVPRLFLSQGLVLGYAQCRLLGTASVRCHDSGSRTSCRFPLIQGAGRGF